MKPNRIAEKAGVKLLGSTPFWNAHIHRFELENGLKVLTLLDKSAPVVAYMTWYRVGSRHEKEGKTGLAHLFEHLMFNETEHLAAGQFDRRLEEAGAETNAATWFDWTYYYESVPKDALGLVIKLEAERMAHLVLRAPQVASEKEVVANERRYRVDDDVDGIMNETLYAKAFTVHPYHWPTIGWMNDIQSFSPEDCESFYRTYYAPNNATIVVCGDFDEARTLKNIKAAYGSFSRAVIPPEDTHPEPHQLEERRTEMRKNTPTDRVMIGYRGPALGDPEHAPLSVLNEILFGGRASRVHHDLVIEHEIASELRGWVSTFRDPGLYEISAAAREGHHAGEIISGIDAQLERAKETVPSDQELARAKARLELGTLQALETAAGKAEQIGFFETVLGDPAGAFRRLEAIRRVGPGDVRRAARRFFDTRARTIVIAHPEGSP
jgi:zinc protease